MEMWWVLLLLVMFPSSSHAQQGNETSRLECFNDFVSNVTCVWHCDGHVCDNSGGRCILTGTLKIGNRYSHSNCSLMVPRNEGCTLNFNGRRPFSYDTVLPLEVKCDGHSFNKLNYAIRHTIKMPAPTKPEISNTTISWNFSDITFVDQKTFELQYGDTEKKEDETIISINQNQYELPEDLLGKGKQYWFRVRVRPEGANYPDPKWSEWSQVTTWQTPRPGPAEDPDSWLVRVCVIGSFLVLTFLFLILLKRSCCVGITKPSNIPDPSKFFEGLESGHGGNLKSWLGSIMSVKSLGSGLVFETTYPVEVFKVMDVSSLSVQKVSGKKQLRVDHDKGASSSFSNMQYFTRDTSTSADLDKLDPCPSPHEPLGGNSGTEREMDMFLDHGNGKHSFDMKAVVGAIQTCWSYEDLEKLRVEAQSPDSGFSGGTTDKESWEEEEEEQEGNGLGFKELVPLAVSEMCSETIAKKLFPPEFCLQNPPPCFSTLPIPGLSFDPLLCSRLLGVDAALLYMGEPLEPSGDGYMPVQK
ncbi:interleukin-2 receptor subunit beta isoform X2 [Denticeps clupeoides]|uniref:Fibronectin type-III domain-containing protein n=1 Tax=Denticeps clupeoides TaxID=299321 RepID=A0AAY3ZVW8_9TELE|nr:interleukin-2 receptor subunit beta-like isoform X2 [Denticeps clupeoides]